MAYLEMESATYWEDRLRKAHEDGRYSIEVRLWDVAPDGKARSVWYGALTRKDRIEEALPTVLQKSSDSLISQLKLWEYEDREGSL